MPFGRLRIRVWIWRQLQSVNAPMSGVRALLRLPGASAGLALPWIIQEGYAGNIMTNQRGIMGQLKKYEMTPVMKSWRPFVATNWHWYERLISNIVGDHELASNDRVMSPTVLNISSQFFSLFTYSEVFNPKIWRDTFVLFDIVE
jgi:hypothetical protein